MKSLMKKATDLSNNGSEDGVVYIKTAFYYSFIPVVLYLGKI